MARRQTATEQIMLLLTYEDDESIATFNYYNQPENGADSILSLLKKKYAYPLLLDVRVDSDGYTIEVVFTHD